VIIGGKRSEEYDMQLANEYKEINLETIGGIKLEGNRNWQILQAAKMYTMSGLWVVPLRKNTKILPSKEYNFNYGNATNKSSTTEKWFGPEGKFEGWNIGLATGKDGGTFVVDVDMHKNKNGIVTLQEIEKEHGQMPDCPVQSTPSGGKHYLFHWQEGGTNSTNKLGVGIDTRGGDENSCKGHIVVWPSIVNGNKYEWIKEGNRAVIPMWITEKMGVPWRGKGKVTKIGRGNEEVGDDDVEIQVSTEQLSRMLSSIDPNSLGYDDWLRVGMSIKSQHPGEDGFELWNSWSEGGDRYEANECHIRWEGLSELGAVRVGTLFHFAKEAGWEPDKEKKDKHANPLKELVHEMNDEFAVMVIGGKLKILREKKGKYDPVFGHYELLDKDAFRGILEPFKVEIIKDNGKMAYISKADIWLGDTERRSYPHGIECSPDGKIRTGTYNSWSGFSVKPAEGNCELMLQHIRNIICSGNDEWNKWLLDWCAFAVQSPGELPGTCIVMKGGEGTGKGTLADTMGRFFGPHYRHLIDSTHLLSNFNSHMMDAAFVFADEITYGGEIKVAGKLKGMVTEQYLIGERKGIDAVGYKNMISMMIASNEDWVVPVGPKSRRWFILDVSDSHANDKAYFDAIYGELESGGKEAFLHFLMTRNITNNLRKAPRTRELDNQASQMATAFNPVIRWWIRKITEGMLMTPNIRYNPSADEESWPTFVKMPELLIEYISWCKDMNVRNTGSDMLFYKKMTELGFKKTKIQMGGKHIKCSRVPTLNEAKVALIQAGYALPEDEEDEDDSSDSK